MAEGTLIADRIEQHGSPRQPRLLIFIVAYQAESTIEKVLARIPDSLAENTRTEVLVIDDSSSDQTFQRGRDLARNGSLPFPVTVLFNPVNQGYGGNQKIGYHYARKYGFDFVALLHGDGQYAPESLPDLLIPLRDGTADACFGSRMMVAGAARKGGMPLYKFVGNKILSWFENRMLRSNFTEFHSGYRVYSVAALTKVPFDLNTDDFHFDTEIIIQFLIAGLRLVERAIPTYYGDEICRVNGMKYAWQVVRAVVKARLQELGVFYDRRFDCAADRSSERYQVKFGFSSPHTLALAMVPTESRVVDLGCSDGKLGDLLRWQKACNVTGVDCLPPPCEGPLNEFVLHDLNQGMPNFDFSTTNVVLLLDVIEHLREPETFVRAMRQTFSSTPGVNVLVSTGNVGFIILRFMLLFGQFNYGKRGILDLKHARLFTFASLRRLFEQHGFRVLESHGVPAPYPLVVRGRLGRVLLRVNEVLIRMSKRLFAYQIFMKVQPLPSLDYLLDRAETSAAQHERTDR